MKYTHTNSPELVNIATIILIPTYSRSVMVPIGRLTRKKQVRSIIQVALLHHMTLVHSTYNKRGKGTEPWERVTVLQGNTKS